MSQPQPVPDPTLAFFDVPESRTTRRLGLDQIRQFNASGYLVGLRAFDGDEAVRRRSGFDRLLAQAAALGMDAYAVTNYERVCSSLFDLVVHPRVLDAVEDILGPDILCWGTHCFTKLAGDEKQVSWHQDATYWKLFPSKTVTAWIAIDDVGSDNGAMRVIPGSHRRGPLAIRQSAPHENNALWLTVDAVETLGAPVRMEQPAGCFSLHSDLLLHDSPPNPSPRRRCGLAVRYCTPDVRIRDGGGRAAVVCRGSDPSGYWDTVPRPQADDITVTVVQVGCSVARPVNEFRPAEMAIKPTLER